MKQKRRYPVALAIKKLEQKLDYQFKDKSLLELALKHRSLGAKNNERLEYLGDAILGFIVADLLFKKFPKASEGQLSRLRALVVKGVSLAEIALDLDLSQFVKLGPGELKSGGNRRESILADTVEAILGAIYLDSNEATLRKIILKLFHEKLSELSLEKAEKDPKTRLQELLQSRHFNLPDYTVTDTHGKDHAQQFQVSCRVEYKKGEIFVTTSTATSRRKAEQQAAENMLNRLISLH